MDSDACWDGTIGFTNETGVRPCLFDFPGLAVEMAYPMVPVKTPLPSGKLYQIEELIGSSVMNHDFDQIVQLALHSKPDQIKFERQDNCIPIGM